MKHRVGVSEKVSDMRLWKHFEVVWTCAAYESSWEQSTRRVYESEVEGRSE